MDKATSSLLEVRAVERVWGRDRLPDGFRQFETGPLIGEIWHEAPGTDPELLVKHLFTSERLSIQVHPNDSAARARGYPRGKDEAWLIIDAEPGATIGVGLRDMVSPDALRQAALHGSIAELVEWWPVSVGDFFYSPGGTVHAIGGGLSLIEVQQNLDLTYRLYDWGRPRELHLEDGVDVADRGPWSPAQERQRLAPGRDVLAQGSRFVVELWAASAPIAVCAGGAPILVIPTRGGVQVDGTPAACGSVINVGGEAELVPAGVAELLIAYPGAAVRHELWSN